MELLLSKRPGLPVFLQLAGRASMEKGDYEKAKGYYIAMNRQAPELYLPYLKLGECAMKSGDNKEAKAYFNQFFKTLGDRNSVNRKQAQRYMKKL